MVLTYFGGFGTNIATVLLGTIVAQAITLLTLTYAALFLGPAEFGFYTIVFVIAAPIGLLGTLRLEASFIYVNNAKRIFASGVTAINALGLLCLITAGVALFLRVPTIGYASALAFLLGANACVINLSNFRQDYKFLSWVRISIAVLFLIFTVTFIAFSLPLPLVFSTLFSQLFGLLLGLFLHRKWMVEFGSRISFAEKKAILHDNFSFFVFNGSQSLFSSLQETVVVLIISQFLGLASVGVYAFAQRVLRAPISVVSEAVGRVVQLQIRSNSEADIQVRKGFIVKVLASLGLAAGGLAFTLYFVVSLLADKFFGPQWDGLSGLMQAMSIYTSFVFIAATIAVFPLALGKPKSISILGIFGTVIYVTIIFISIACGLSLENTFWIVSAIMPLYFLFFIRRVYKIVTC